jgi:ADP-ribosylglycohydrolase
MVPSAAKDMKLEPGDDLLVSFDAKWSSGDDRIGLALDYRTIEPGKGFGPDDDTSYQIIGLHALETYGPGLSSRQIGKEWLEHVPQIPDSLAEGLAMKRMRSGIEPPESGEHPIGEAIGGQMKGEIWGLICPGRPDLAAEYARRDGVVAHCKNGVYGEQFVASMISAAFYEKSISKLIETGLGSIPDSSKYADVVREVIAWHSKYPDWRDTRRELIAKYPNVCNPVYAEAGIVTLALLYGNGDFERSICIAASCGSDTDCNSATVGALLGCIQGFSAIPGKWKEPVGDSFTCFAKGYEQWSISELSKRICAAGKKTLEYHGRSMTFTIDP